jgi:aspartate 1-decarboxylase
MRTMLRSKIHRATVTGAELHYEGSVTIDADLLERADILPYQQVDIWNVSNGERFTTYALEGQPGSGVVCINGAAAHKARKGDLVIIATFAQMSEEEARRWKPTCVFVDARNRPLEQRTEHGGQAEVTAAWPRAASCKRQASSHQPGLEPQASSIKLQAISHRAQRRR